MGKLKYYFSRFLSKLKPNAIINCNIDKTAHIGHGNQLVNCCIGKYSYIGDGSTLCYVKLGSFCSIAPNCVIGGASHPIDFVSTSPAFHSGRNVLGKNFAEADYNPYSDVLIGNDVWIGNGCFIKQGVTVSDGAVIGMGSVLTKDVGPYEIWAGNPAKFIRKRFDDETAEQLQAIKWWDFSEEDLKRYGEYFNAPKKFIGEYEKQK